MSEPRIWAWLTAEQRERIRQRVLHDAEPEVMFDFHWDKSEPEPPPTERDGLSVGDSIMVNGRWPALVEGFSYVPCDVIVRWTGKRPDSLGEVNTICRKHVPIEGDR